MSKQRLLLSDGTPVLIEKVGGVEEDVARREVTQEFSTVLPSLVRLCDDLAGALAAIAPQKATVEFGVSLTVETSGLALLVAKAGAEANFKIGLEWEKPGNTPTQ